MTEKSVIAATYADWKLVKTRSAVQLVFEIDASQADLAYKVLGGMPQTGGQVEVAIARLSLRGDVRAPASTQVVVPSSGGEGERKNSPRAEKTPAQKAAIRCVLLCKEPAFQKWLKLKSGVRVEPSEEQAAEDVRVALDCTSRRDIAADPDAYDRWVKLVGEYDDYVRYGDRR